ncbi:MAG: hypothetical protein ACPGLY_18845 [Rubripirellula sp.]
MNGHILKVLLLGFVAACASCRTCSAQDEKLPPPSEDQRSEVMKLLQEIYKSEYVAAETSEAKSALATKILDAANETADNAARYSMLKLAADIAVRAADSEIVNESIDLMDRFYEIDEPNVRLAALIGVAKNIDSQSEPAALSAVIGFCRRAIDRNDYVAAEQLLTISEVNFREAASRRELTELASRVKTLQRQFESVRDHLQKLLEDPEDPEANLAVGRFRCFGRNDWSVGLKNLARGSDETLREIAQLELAGGNDIDRQILIADRWWQYAENVKGEVAVRAKLHAGSYYKIAVDSLQGLQRAKAATRLREAESLGEIVTIEMIAGGDVAPPKPAAPEPMNEWKVVYEMPATYSDVAVGGSGRYLIFRLDSLKKLAFFDVMKREITQYVPIESSDVRFTAGANEFFIATRPQNVMERWSLDTFKRLSTVKLPLENPVEVVMMGSASEGPIYVGAQHGPGGFLNPRSLKPIAYQVVDHRYQRAGEIQGAGPESRVRASANGRAFAMWRTNVSPGGFRTYVLTDRILHTFYQHDTMGYIEPSPDGELMYTSRGVYTSQTKEYLANKGNFATSFRIPAVTGNYAIGVLRDDDRKKKNVNPIHILVSGQVDPILTIPDVSIRTGEYGDFHGRELMTLARRVYLLPNANLLITLPVSNKSLVLHYLDLEQELRESGVDFLYVASRAPTSVKSGGVYKYQLDVKSKHGDVEYEIVAGPSGMRVSDDGLVTWRTPRRGSEQQEVIVLIKDGNGQQTTHAFTVATTL